MNDPIPVSLAIRAVERAIRECEIPLPGPWEVGSAPVVRFAVLARAGFRSSLEYVKGCLEWEDECGVDEVDESYGLYTAVAPLIAHYDAVQPGWRTE